MADGKYDTVVVEGLVITETSKATLMKIDGADVWMPKSQFKRMSEQTREKEEPRWWALFIPRWLAEDKDLDYVEETEWDDLKEE